MVRIPATVLKESFRLSESFQEQMKVYESAIRIPSLNRTLYVFIIHGSIASEPLRQAVAGTHIIAGKDIDFPETA